MIAYADDVLKPGPSMTEPHMGITCRNALTLGTIAALGAWPAYSQPVAQPDASPAEARRTTFDEVWETVRDRFYDRDLRGLDWPAIRKRYQPVA
jgi:carboxyl-terminal processing protease